MGLFDKIKNGMRRTREAFTGRMDELVENYKELDDDFYEDLTDILIMADVGHGHLGAGGRKGCGRNAKRKRSAIPPRHGRRSNKFWHIFCGRSRCN